jgi:hypothetical protein
MIFDDDVENKSNVVFSVDFVVGWLGHVGESMTSLLTYRYATFSHF